jgi:transcriptional regulator with XRE-family HTH domain
MTPLKKWKKEQGLTYEGIVSRLGGKWKRVHISNVFNGHSTPSTALLCALQAATGLSNREILGGFVIPSDYSALIQGANVDLYCDPAREPYHLREDKDD